MSKLPTDLQVLEKIYGQYGAVFRTSSVASPPRAHRNYIPIDVRELAAGLGADQDELFGRLYYHLDHKHQYRRDDGSLVHLFALSVGDDRHCINFPYLSALLADYRSEHRKVFWPLAISVASSLIAVAALFFNLGGQ
jgi:hypothetical protein